MKTSKSCLKKALYTLVIVAFIMQPLQIADASEANEKPSVLVLGIECIEIDDIFDRIIRENIMRKLSANGIRIIKVMEIEDLIQLDNLDIRKPDTSKLPYYADEKNADYIVFSKMEKTNSNNLLTITIFDSRKNRVMQKTVKIEKIDITSHPIRYKEKLSDAIYSNIVPVIK